MTDTELEDGLAQAARESHERRNRRLAEAPFLIGADADGIYLIVRSTAPALNNSDAYALMRQLVRQRDEEE